MRRPVGVTVAAVILGLIAVLGLLGVAFSFIGMFLMHNPALHHAARHEGASAQAVVAGTDLVLSGILVFCLWTVVGLFRLRRWARYSVVVVGILIFILASAMSALMLVLRHFVSASPKATMSLAQLSLISMVLVAFGAFYAVIALVGLWWAVYFNLKHVRRAFAGGSAMIEGQTVVETPCGPWQVVVIVFACLMLFGSVMVLGLASLRMPFFWLGILIHGKSAIAVYLAFAIVQLFIGIGLLTKLRPAYWTAVGWQVFGVLNTALFLIPGYAARALAAGTEATRRFTLPSPINQPAALHLQREFMVLGGALSLALILVFLYALLRCRRSYLGSGSAVDTA